jgi:tRNA-splicing endonuclease subunit Sen54
MQLKHVPEQAFEAIRVIPSGFEEPLSDPPIKPAENPFKVFWHVYKPITKIQKTQPPAPDFYVAVIE